MVASCEPGALRSSITPASSSSVRSSRGNVEQPDRPRRPRGSSVPIALRKKRAPRGAVAQRLAVVLEHQRGGRAGEPVVLLAAHRLRLRRRRPVLGHLLRSGSRRCRRRSSARRCPRLPIRRRRVRLASRPRRWAGAAAAPAWGSPAMGGDLEEAALVLEDVARPHARDHPQRLEPLLVQRRRGWSGTPSARPARRTCPSPSSRGRPRGCPGWRCAPRCGAGGCSAAAAASRRGRGGCASSAPRRRRGRPPAPTGVRVLVEPVVLDLPHAVVAELVGEHGLLHAVAEHLRLARARSGCESCISKKMENFIEADPFRQRARRHARGTRESFPAERNPPTRPADHQGRVAPGRPRASCR